VAEPGLEGVVLAIFGPTASGKSEVAEAIAERIPAELVSADAMQVYRGLPLLTNQSAYPTRLVGIWPLSHASSVAEYAPLAHAAIDEILAAGRTPVVVGGTGLYLRAALTELDVPPPPTPGTRERLEALYERLGAEDAHAALAERDPGAAAHVHPNDRRRVLRALELAEAGASLRPRRDRLWSEETRHPTLLFGLEVPREELGELIEARTLRMFDAGVEQEVAQALEEPISRTARMIHGILDISSLPRAEAIESYNRRVKRYAAYQRKWMRKMPNVTIVRRRQRAGETADALLEMARTGQRVPDCAS
jgi:tRNA dimethylallyltransferase